ncbi:hypothetical protein [Burkholderia cenocepacia]|uniref:hypothetical protein n=1 Tax=Burkholderia cenocepacia TaxID=95486 RepID=UPI002AB68B6D|nr:hypothetical protein [Burkholderia cenocepacia]
MDEPTAQQALERAENLARDLDARENTADSAVQAAKRAHRALRFSLDLPARRYAAQALAEARAARHELRQQRAAAQDAVDLARANLLEARRAVRAAAAEADKQALANLGTVPDTTPEPPAPPRRRPGI